MESKCVSHRTIKTDGKVHPEVLISKAAHQASRVTMKTSETRQRKTPPERRGQSETVYPARFVIRTSARAIFSKEKHRETNGWIHRSMGPLKSR